jgi:hypothetical protein
MTVILISPRPISKTIHKSCRFVLVSKNMINTFLTLQASTEKLQVSAELMRR